MWSCLPKWWTHFPRLITQWALWYLHMDSYVNLSSRIADIFSKGNNSVKFMSFFLFLGWVTVCLVFSIIALILSLVSAVCGVLGLLVADTEQKKRRFYLSAGGFMSFVGTFKLTLTTVQVPSFAKWQFMKSNLMLQLYTCGHIVTGILILTGSLTCCREANTMGMVLDKC